MIKNGHFVSSVFLDLLVLWTSIVKVHFLMVVFSEGFLFIFDYVEATVCFLSHLTLCSQLLTQISI